MNQVDQGQSFVERFFFLGARFVERGLPWASALEREIEKNIPVLENRAISCTPEPLKVFKVKNTVLGDLSPFLSFTPAFLSTWSSSDHICQR